MNAINVPTREQVSPANQAIFDKLEGSIGFVPNLYAVFAYSEHALEAFDVGAEDYLLKPLEPTSLKRALQRPAIRIAPSPPASAVAAPQRLTVHTAKGVVFVDAAELLYARLDGELTTLHTRSGPLLVDLSLKQLHDLLPDARFWRVHRRALLNLEGVDRLESVESGGYIAHMADGATVPVSRQAGRRLRKRLGVPG